MPIEPETFDSSARDRPPRRSDLCRISIPCGPEWRGAVQALADHQGLAVTSLIHQAIMAYADMVHYYGGPDGKWPRRIPKLKASDRDPDTEPRR